MIDGGPDQESIDVAAAGRSGDPARRYSTDAPFVSWHSINNKPQGSRSMAAAVAHNRRMLNEPAAASVDKRQPSENFALFGLSPDPAMIRSELEDELRKRGFVARRTDAVIAVECVFSLAAAPTSFNMRAYFEACCRWAESGFGGRMVSADVHLDESSPHCHCIVLLPLQAGGPPGSQLIGDKSATERRYADFHAKVGSRYGLQAMTPRLSPMQRREASELVHRQLRETADPLLTSATWPVAVAWIDRDPMPWLRVLGVPLPTGPTLRGLAQSAGKGPKTRSLEAASDARLTANHNRPRGAQLRSVADAEPCRGPQKPAGPSTSILCRGPSAAAASSEPPELHVIPCQPDSFRREREDDRLAQDWDTVRGEWPGKPAALALPVKAAAQAWVAEMLQQVGEPA